jgi:hypothetical protein
MATFWTVLTIATVVAIVAVVVWAFVIQPLRVPRHHAH